MAHIVCFGELLLRFSPVSNGGWLQQATMPVFAGGAELNVARALTNWQIPVRLGTVLPVNALADDLIDYLTEHQIDTSIISRAGQRIGTYYLPQGADLKHAGVIYDRAYSAFSELKPGQLDYDALLADATWLHLSAISPALNPGVAEVCAELAAAAAARNIPVSIDLNYRASLWQPGREPAKTMSKIVAHCDVVMGNIWSANTLLGIPLDPQLPHYQGSAEYIAHAKTTAETIQARFPRCRVVANTFRFDEPPTGLRHYTTLYQDGQQYVSPERRTATVVDRVGSGDCFMAGLIYGLHHHHAPQSIVDFAAKAAFGKLQELGDSTRQTIADILHQQCQ